MEVDGKVLRAVVFVVFARYLFEFVILGHDFNDTVKLGDEFRDF